MPALQPEPCPFCQSTTPVATSQDICDSETLYWVHCHDCQATGPIARSADVAVFRWNAARRSAAPTARAEARPPARSSR